MRITALEASAASDRSLSVHVCLSEPGTVTLVITLTAPDGREVGGTEVMVGRRTRELTVEVPLAHPVRGTYRLKATLSLADEVIDNARIDLHV